MPDNFDDHVVLRLLNCVTARPQSQKFITSIVLAIGQFLKNVASPVQAKEPRVYCLS